MLEPGLGLGFSEVELGFSEGRARPLRWRRRQTAALTLPLTLFLALALPLPLSSPKQVKPGPYLSGGGVDKLRPRGIPQPLQGLAWFGFGFGLQGCRVAGLQGEGCSNLAEWRVVGPKARAR